jgi:MoaA/NifB/PqqE/SkfB family radical SAM enzyme
MCAINHDSRYRNDSGRPRLFAPDLFERLVSAFPTLVRAYLFGLGEPLLNPHMIDYIERLSSSGVEVWFNTNGTLIDNVLADRIAAAGADRITVSIDGATQATYERIRRGARFEDVTRGIRALARAGRLCGRPKVNLSFVAMRSNIRELPMLADLCADLGATGIHVEPLYGQQQPELERHYAEENLGTVDHGLIEECLAETVERARTRGIDVASRFLSGNGSFDYVERSAEMRVGWPCSEPWSSIWVTAAGEVRTCCINETSFGSLFEDDLRSIWNGEAFRRFRGQHAARGAAVPEGCGNCIRNGRPRHSPFFRAVEPVTYRPLEFEPVSGETPAMIRWPQAGDVVTDPLVVTGRRLTRDHAVRWEMMIDREQVGYVDESCLTESGAFVVHGPVPYLTEGVHVLWFRERGRADGRGWGHREVHFRRGERAESSVCATSFAALPIPSPARGLRVFIDGQRWDDFAIERTSGSQPIVMLDVSSLSAGRHEVSVRRLLSRPLVHVLERLA